MAIAPRSPWVIPPFSLARFGVSVILVLNEMANF